MMNWRHAHASLPPLVLVLLLGGCGEQPNAPQPPPPVLTWFALGGDVHDLREARRRHSDLLRLGSTPRWFVGPPELVSDAEVARRRAAAGIVVEEARLVEGDTPPGMRWLGTTPPLPRRIEEIARHPEGPQLSLGLERRDTDNELRLEISLRAGSRPLWRQAEHRSTNVLPFLFALSVNGEPVRVETTGAAHCGGISRFHQLVAAGATRAWTLRLDATSLPLQEADEVSITALFCERKHTGFAALDGEHPAPQVDLETPYTGDATLIRSNTVTLKLER